MLSIGKLGLGHYAYYEQSVADGREDYYAGAGEETGRFLGRGSAALGFTGDVADGDLKHLFRGTHPMQPGRWLDRQHQDKLKPKVIKLPDGREIVGPAPVATAAFDLTYSAPKSVSVLWALSDGPIARDIKEAHEAAVAQSLDYLERVACLTRRGKAGHRHLRGEGFVAAAYNHRSSRAGDPQLHTHVLVANATKAEGRYTALHGAALYREAKTAGFLYHAALRAELTKRLGVEWTRDPTSPHPEIAGVDRALRDHFSKRADEIAEALAAAGTSSHRAANAAAIDTRASKDYSVDGLELKHRWRNEAAQLDTRDPLNAVARVATNLPPRHVPTRRLSELMDAALSPEGLTRERSTFSRRELLQITANDLLAGGTVADVEALTDTMIDLADDRLVLLDGSSEPLPDRAPTQVDGSELSDSRGDRSYTTRELLEHEHLILDTMRDRAGDGTAQVPAPKAAHLIDARPTGRRLADDQRAMVESLTTSGDGMQVVVGLAGAGKTFSLEAAHDIWRDYGVEVRGCSTALAAARNLQSETAVPSETIARIKYWHAESPEHPAFMDAVPAHGVLIVDEAGMVATRDLSWLVDRCNERHTKIVLVGDHRQLPEIGAGGAFAGLVHRFDDTRGVEQLTINRRQRADWEREALKELRAGSVTDAIAKYVAEEKIIASPIPDELRRRLATDWLDARQRFPQVAMVAYTNNDVDALNAHVRAELDRRGELGTTRIVIAGKEWTTGDELLCLRNNRALQLVNGTRGRVSEVAASGLTLTDASGQSHFVPADYLERGHATYGWATTGHKAQGQTISGEAFVLASEHVSREWMYVAMSRAKEASRVYIDTLDRDPATGKLLTTQEQHDAAVIELHRLASRSDAKHLALDEDPTSVLSHRDLRRLSGRADLPPAASEALTTPRDLRLAALGRELVSKPPPYLLPLLGPVPSERSHEKQWAIDAARLETYRRRHRMTTHDMNVTVLQRVLGRGPRHGRSLGRDL